MQFSSSCALVQHFCNVYGTVTAAAPVICLQSSISNCDVLKQQQQVTPLPLLNSWKHYAVVASMRKNTAFASVHKHTDFRLELQ